MWNLKRPNSIYLLPALARLHRFGAKHSLRYFGVHLWNKLEISDRENPNFKGFRSSMKYKDLSSDKKKVERIQELTLKAVLKTTASYL